MTVITFRFDRTRNEYVVRTDAEEFSNWEGTASLSLALEYLAPLVNDFNVPYTCTGGVLAFEFYDPSVDPNVPSADADQDDFDFGARDGEITWRLNKAAYSVLQEAIA